MHAAALRDPPPRAHIDACREHSKQSSPAAPRAGLDPRCCKIRTQHAPFTAMPMADLTSVLRFDQHAASNCASLVASRRCINAVIPLAPHFRFCFRHDNVQGKELLERGVWEETGTFLVVHALAVISSAVFLDVGANFGWYTTIAASLGHRVLAVEPKVIFQCYAALNAELNNATARVALFGHGADERPRVMHMEGIDMKSSVKSAKTVTGIDYERVTTIALDYLRPMLTLGTPLVVKMDIQSFECEALMGAKKLLQHADLRLLLMEWDESARATQRGCDWDRAFDPLWNSINRLRPHSVRRRCATRVGYEPGSLLQSCTAPLARDWRQWSFIGNDIVWLPPQL